MLVNGLQSVDEIKIVIYDWIKDSGKVVGVNGITKVLEMNKVD